MFVVILCLVNLGGLLEWFDVFFLYMFMFD